MRKFAVKFAIFMFPLLSFLGIVELRLRAVESAYAVKRMKLERNIGQTRVLISGSSHAFHGIRLQTLGVPTFNVAFDSQDIYYDTRILLKYLPRARNVGLVIVSISYFSFKGTLEDNDETRWITSYYRQFWDIPRASPSFRVQDYSLIALYEVPRVRTWLLHGFPGGALQMDENGGYTDISGTNLAAVRDARATVERHTRGLTPGGVMRVRSCLNELFGALEARSIPSVIITSPCFHTYYDALKPENYEIMQNEIRALSQTFGIEYRNYLMDPRFQESDFQDCDHLNTNGAERFSRILRNDIIEVYVK